MRNVPWINDHTEKCPEKSVEKDLYSCDDHQAFPLQEHAPVITSRVPPCSHGRKQSPESSISRLCLFWGLTCAAVIILCGHVQDFLHRFVLRTAAFQTEKNFMPLVFPKEYFFTRWMFGRVRDCWDRPISSCPGSNISVLEREFEPNQGWFMNESCRLTGRKREGALNLGSYNYLGFARTSGKCIDDVIESVKEFGVGTAGTRIGSGTTVLHTLLDETVAEFVGKEDAISFPMGYATNSTTIPALVGKGCLIVSDALNHASIVIGCRTSGAKTVVFKHNEPEDLERVIRQAVREGQPRTHMPWKKILIIVEGIYSMEGEICRLPEIIAIKKKYKAYLYVDEAHSIGALGSSARGVCDYHGVNTDDVDILMGTFTKSFGSVGGYIAGSKDLITYLRQTSFGQVYTTSMSVPCVQMILSAFQVIMGRDGTLDGVSRIAALKRNSNYFRNRLSEEGFRILGDPDSPIVPLLLYHPAKLAQFSRECLKEGIAVVVVSYPATSLFASRARFCLSADHTIEGLERAVQTITKLGDTLFLKYGPIPSLPEPPAKEPERRGERSP